MILLIYIFLDLEHARSFSFRNGFGPTVVYPPILTNEDMNITKARRLQLLLSTFTAAEEAAIHQIILMVSII